MLLLTKEVWLVDPITVLHSSFASCHRVVENVTRKVRENITVHGVAIEGNCFVFGDRVIVLVSMSNLIDRFVCHLLHDRVNGTGGVSNSGEILSLSSKHTRWGGCRGWWHKFLEVYGCKALLQLSGGWWEGSDQFVDIARHRTWYYQHAYFDRDLKGSYLPFEVLKL
jgi:hypothetical protein